MNTQPDAEVEDTRPELLVSMHQSGYAEFILKPGTGGIFRLSEEVARAVIQDADRNGLRLGFPQELSALAEGLWVGWTILPDALRLVGRYPNRLNTYCLDLPLSRERSEQLAAYNGNLTLGLLDIDEANSFSIRPAQTLSQVSA